MVILNLFLLFLAKYTFALEKGELCKTNIDGKEYQGMVLSKSVCSHSTQNMIASEEILNRIFNNTDLMSNLNVCCPLRKSEIQCHLYYPQQDVVYFIFGGEKAKENEFPHMVALGYGTKKHIRWDCGGSLISKNFVLTAAHCVNSKQNNELPKWIRVGALDLVNKTETKNAKTFDIKRIILHRNYKKKYHYHDIALIEFKGASNLKPICLHTDLYPIPEQVVISGWGKTDLLGASSSHLLKANVKIINIEKCTQIYANVSKRELPEGIIDREQVCAGADDGKDTCPGDSGGPLQYLEDAEPVYYRLVGVTSFGKGCGFQNSAGVYTRVSNYLNWIERLVWPDAKTNNTIKALR